MRRLTAAIGSALGKARGMVRRGGAAEDRRQSFHREFGQYPPHFEASSAERERFAHEVVRPVLAQRAHAVQRAAAGAAGEPMREAQAAFDRAYQAAVALKVAETGKTYHDYLGQSG